MNGAAHVIPTNRAYELSEMEPVPFVRTLIDSKIAPPTIGPMLRHATQIAIMLQ